MFWNRGEIPFKDGNSRRPNKIHGNDFILITVGFYSNISDATTSTTTILHAFFLVDYFN